MAKAWSHSAILVTGRCFDLQRAVSPKLKQLNTRSPNSMNAPASIFCTKLGGIDELGGSGTGGIIELGGGVVVVGASTLTWLRSRPGARGGGARVTQHLRGIIII